MTNELRVNASLVEALGSALRSGDHGLKTVPALLRRVLAEGRWREFVTQRGELVRHERFEDFVTAPPLKGIGADMDLVHRLVADDPAIEALLEQVSQRKKGRNPDNIKVSRDPATVGGTGRSYALRRLRQDAPDFHQRVLSGELSPHAAMVAAGLRAQTFTIRITNPESIAKTLRRRLTPELLAEVRRELDAA